MELNSKYPRTYHIPWSPGATSDDKKLDVQWFYANGWAGSEIVITEKMDGENTCFTRNDVFSRSHSTPTRSPWSRNLWDTDGLLWRIKNEIGEDEYVYGENLYGEHSIHYDNLPDYFFMFGARVMNEHQDVWYPWDDVEYMAELMGVKTVPVLYKGRIESEPQLRRMIEQFMSEPSTFGKEKEGVVIRKVQGFDNQDFSKNVCKFVRENHVQTDEHWTKNWKKAELK